MNRDAGVVTELDIEHPEIDGLPIRKAGFHQCLHRKVHGGE